VPVPSPQFVIPPGLSEFFRPRRPEVDEQGRPVGVQMPRGQVGVPLPGADPSQAAARVLGAARGGQQPAPAMPTQVAERPITREQMADPVNVRLSGPGSQPAPGFRSEQQRQPGFQSGGGAMPQVQGVSGVPDGTPDATGHEALLRRAAANRPPDFPVPAVMTLRGTQRGTEYPMMEYNAAMAAGSPYQEQVRRFQEEQAVLQGLLQRDDMEQKLAPATMQAKAAQDAVNVEREKMKMATSDSALWERALAASGGDEFKAQRIFDRMKAGPQVGVEKGPQVGLEKDEETQFWERLKGQIGDDTVMGQLAQAQTPEDALSALSVARPDWVGKPENRPIIEEMVHRKGFPRDPDRKKQRALAANRPAPPRKFAGAFGSAATATLPAALRRAGLPPTLVDAALAAGSAPMSLYKEEGIIDDQFSRHKGAFTGVAPDEPQGELLLRILGLDRDGNPLPPNR
jgi:hypothetical protein